MNITRITSKVFAPVTVTVDICTPEELDAVYSMCCLDVSIPDLVAGATNNSSHFLIIQNFLNGLSTALGQV